MINIDIKILVLIKRNNNIEIFLQFSKILKF